ncbi:MAG TPA: hypothetical protein VK009_19190 [Chloroflexota bacterium]|nr:hypothetical protein [Chloroflexota bacterium]
MRVCLAASILLPVALQACAVTASQPAAATQSQTATGPIVWAKDRPLTWQDFQGPVPPDRLKTSLTDRLAAVAGMSSGGHEAAETMTIIPGAVSHYAFQCTTPPSGPATCHITQFSTDPVQAQFDPARSWVITSDASDDLLRHEQGHFDIAAVFAARLNTTLRDAASLQQLSVSDTTADSAQAKLKAEVDGRVQSLEQDVTAAFSREEQLYDDETKHGTDRAHQQQWLTRIHDELAQASG